MTALERTLATTFRAARWPDGRPVCSKCFDGEDLVVNKGPLNLAPGLYRYRCTVCDYTFSDLTGTIFFTAKPVSLALWAYLILFGDPARLEDLRERQLRRCWELSAKVKGRSLTDVWRTVLQADGITLAKLKRPLDAARSAA